MITDTSTQLAKQGFGPFALYQVGLPYQAWRVTLRTLSEQGLPVGESTLLKLIEAGVTRREALEALMGLSNEPAFRDLLLSLIDDGAIFFKQTELTLTLVGEQMLENAQRQREELLTPQILLFDPYRERFIWRGEKLSRSSLLRRGCLPLSPTAELPAGTLREHISDLQDLLNDGIPEEEGPAPRRRLLDLDATPYGYFYDVLAAELYYKPEFDQWALILKEGGVDNVDLTRLVLELATDTEDVLPPLPAPGSPASKFGKEISELSLAHESWDSVPIGAEREAVRKLFETAQEELLVIVPSEFEGELDIELLDWLEESLVKTKGLHASLVVGESFKGSGETEQALKGRLRSLRRKLKQQIAIYMTDNLQGHSLIAGESATFVAKEEFIPVRSGASKGYTRSASYILEGVSGEIVSALKQQITSRAVTL